MEPQGADRRSPLKIAAVTAAASGILLVGLWLIRGGAGEAEVELDVPVALDTPPRAPGLPSPVSPREARAPVIGAFEAAVARRLARHQRSVQPLRGSLAIVARDVLWLESNGAEFARAEEAMGRLDMEMLSRGDIVVSDVVLVQPDVELRESGTTWNYEVVLAAFLDGEAGADGSDGRNGGVTALVNRATIRRGNVDVQTAERSFSLEQLDAVLPRVTFRSPTMPHPEIIVSSASAILNEPAKNRKTAVSAADGRARIVEEGVAFEANRAVIQGAVLADVSGIWSETIPVYGVEARGRAPEVRLADIAQFLPEKAPTDGVAAFDWSIERVSAKAVEIALTNLRLQSETSVARGAVAFRLELPRPAQLWSADLTLDPLNLALVETFTGPLPFAGLLRGTVRGARGDLQFDLAGELTSEQAPEPFTVHLMGNASVTPEGFAVGTVTADLTAVPLHVLRPYVPGLPLTGTVSGRLVLNGLPNRAPMRVNVTLNLASGSASLVGTLDLTGAVPAYDLTGELVGINIQQLIEPAAPPVFLTAGFSLAGRGTDPASAEAAVRLRGEFSGWQAVPGDMISLIARVQAGTLAVDTLAARLATLQASGSGVWRFLEPMSGAVRYAVSISSLTPWGPYLPVIGDTLAAGSLAASGTVTGSLEAPHLEGEVTGRQIHSGGWAASGLQAEYELTLGGTVPEGRATIAAQGVETPTAGAYPKVTGAITLERPQFELTLDAERAGGGRVGVTAIGHMPETGPRDLILQRADIDLVQGHWTLVAPAAFRWGEGPGVVVENLELREAATSGLLRVDGRVLPLTGSDFEVETAAFPIDEFQELLGLRPVVSGDLWTQTRIVGAAPTVDSKFRLENGTIQDIAVNRLEGTVNYADGHVLANGVATDTSGVLEVQVDLPAVLNFAAKPRFALVERGEVSGTLVARNVSIAPLQALAPQVQDLKGQIEGLVGLTGTVEEPTVDGNLVLTGGSVRVPALRQTYTNMTARLVLDGRTITVTPFRAYSDGPMTVTGHITLEDLTSPVTDLDVHFEKFRAVGVAGATDAALYGDITVNGPLEALELSGNVRVADGYVPIPQFGVGTADFLSEMPAGEVLGLPAGPAAANSLYDGLKITDVRVRVGTDVWFTAEAARAQLSGELTINKNVEDEFTIVGTLEGERGSYTLQAGPIVRNFEITHAEVRFLGGAEINPAIDITARRIVFDASGGEIHMDVRVTGTVRSPKLDLASPDAPDFPPEELLSMLFFGRSSLELGGGGLSGAEVLETTFLGSWAELATLELEETLVRNLGLSFDIFQVRFGPGGLGGFGAPAFVFGWEVGRDVFLTAETALAGLFESTGTAANPWALRLEWAFAPDARLRASFETVEPTRYVRGIGLRLPITRKQQFSLEVRRRWTY